MVSAPHMSPRTAKYSIRRVGAANAEDAPKEAATPVMLNAGAAVVVVVPVAGTAHRTTNKRRAVTSLNNRIARTSVAAIAAASRETRVVAVATLSAMKVAVAAGSNSNVAAGAEAVVKVSKNTKKR